MVVDAVIRKWATLVGGTQEGAGQEVLGMSIQALSVLNIVTVTISVEGNPCLHFINSPMPYAVGVVI